MIIENDFQESRCVKQIDNLRDCCKKFYKVSLVCSGMQPTSTTEENQNIEVYKYWNKLFYIKKKTLSSPNNLT